MKSDPNQALQDAIAKLKAFNEENSSTATPSLQKTISLMKSYFKSRLSEKKPEKNWRDVKRAIDALKSHYRLIEKLQQGTAQEQKLAASAVAAIEQYNAIIETARQKPQSLNARIQHYFLEQSGNLLPQELSKIQLPKNASLQISYTEKGKAPRVSCDMANPHAAKASLKVSHLSATMVPISPVTSTLPHLSRQAVELFQMKAISLIEQHGLLTNTEARSAMRKAHLQSHIDADPSHCTVSCMLSPFPGHTLTVTGAFERRGESYALPKNNSFQLTLTSLHTGFPHPPQFTGWALPDLVPLFPHCLEDMPLFKPLYQKKLALAHALQPHQEAVEKAKVLTRMKKLAAEKHKEQFLALQQQLILTIAKAAGDESDKTKETITLFFAKLKQVHHFFDYYSETHQIINDSFIARPYAFLETAWLEKRTTPPLAILGDEAEKAKQEFLLQRQQAQSDLEKSTCDFILCMGSLLAAPCHRILLQHFSETRFPPPMLDDFEQKLQISLFRQLKTFLDEMKKDIVDEEIEKALLEQIQTDIALFEAPSFSAIEESDPAAPLVSELEAYFNTRHYTTLN